MKNIKLILLFIFTMGMFLPSCENNVGDAYADKDIFISKEVLNFKNLPKGSTLAITGTKKWDIDTTNTENWCTIIPVHNHQGNEYVTVKVTENKGIYDRSTSFKIVSAVGTREVKVNQIASLPTVRSSKGDTITIGHNKTIVDIELTTNIDFTMESDAPWLVITKDYVNDETLIRVTIEKNSTGNDLKGNLVFTQKDGPFTKDIHFVQKGGTFDYESEGSEDIDGNHRFSIVGATASTNMANKNVEYSFDNNDLTFYQSEWQKISDPVVLEYTLGERLSLHYFIYVPTMSDERKSFAIADIYTKSEGEDYVLRMADYEFEGSKNQTIMFPTPIENPEAVKFVVKAVNNSEEAELICAACAEMKFYSTDLQYSNIFADKSYSSLKTDVTLEDIFEIKDEFFRKIAQYLYNGEYPMIRINDYNSYPTPALKPYSQLFGKFDNATGIYVERGEEVVVMAENIKSNLVKLTVINDGGSFLVGENILPDGVTKFMMQHTGLLYIEYNNPTSLEPITVHIAGGKVNGFYDIAQHTEQEGKQYLEKSVGSYFDLIGKYVHLILPTAELKKNTTSLKALIEKYDRIAELQLQLTNEAPRANRICLMSSKTSEGANDYVIFLPERSSSDFTTVENINGEVLWNLSSYFARTLSISHFKSITPSLMDIFALHSYAEMSGRSKLMDDKIYDEAYQKFFVNGEVFQNMTLKSDLTRVVSYWQLNLYMMKVMGDNHFMQKVNSLYAAGAGILLQNFGNACMDIAQIDFKQFFAAWKYPTPAKVYSTKAPEMLKYINDENYELFKNPISVIGGNYSVKIVFDKVTNTNVGNVTIGAEVKNAVAYEVFSSGHLCAASCEKSFSIPKYVSNMVIDAVSADGSRVILIKK